MNASLRHLLDWQTYDDATWERLVERARTHHAQGKQWSQAAAGKSIGLLFFNPSLRTRTSMELAAAQLGAHATTLNIGQGTWGFAWGDKGMVMNGNEAEHIQEAVNVLSRYYDALGVRVFASGTDYAMDRADRLINTFADAASVPVVNMESAFYHPCQALGDAGTMMTHFDGDVRKKKFVLAWCYHPRALPMAVPNSALLTASRLGMDVTLACPPEYMLDDHVIQLAQSYTNAKNASLSITHDLDAACEDADVIYAKAWGGKPLYKGPEHDAGLRAGYMDWRISEDHLRSSADGRFMHCLPVRRNVVVDDGVLDGNQTLHLLQAEYRLHAQKAILEHAWNLLPR